MTTNVGRSATPGISSGLKTSVEEGIRVSVPAPIDDLQVADADAGFEQAASRSRP